MTQKQTAKLNQAPIVETQIRQSHLILQWAQRWLAYVIFASRRNSVAGRATVQVEHHPFA